MARMVAWSELRKVLSFPSLNQDDGLLLGIRSYCSDFGIVINSLVSSDIDAVFLAPRKIASLP